MVWTKLALCLTGPIEAGKTIAMKAAEQFCFHLVHHVVPFGVIYHLLFTAYLESVEIAFGRCPITKASGMPPSTVTASQRAEWEQVHSLVINEFLFMNEHKLKNMIPCNVDTRTETRFLGDIQLYLVGTYNNS